MMRLNDVNSVITAHHKNNHKVNAVVLELIYQDGWIQFFTLHNQ